MLPPETKRGGDPAYDSSSRADFIDAGLKRLRPVLDHCAEMLLESGWHPEVVSGLIAHAEPHLPALLEDNSHLTAEQLEELAKELSPGGAHTGGLLANVILDDLWLTGLVDQTLLAAIIRHNWHGGKVGFQFLPDPAKANPDGYLDAVYHLIDVLRRGVGGDPRRLLAGDDLAFCDSLPSHFTIYRGCTGISSELAAMGVCWSTKREIAEWFAGRFGDAAVLVTARIKKADVVLVKASEHEVVCTPRRAREIKCRKVTRRIETEWRAAAE